MPIIPDYLCTLDGNSTGNGEDDENGRVGLLLSSKALVQLILNPAVGTFTGTLGYTKPLFLGNLSLLLAATRKLFFFYIFHFHSISKDFAKIISFPKRKRDLYEKIIYRIFCNRFFKSLETIQQVSPFFNNTLPLRGALKKERKRESIVFYLCSVRVRPNLRSTVPGTKRPGHFLGLYRRFRYVAGRLPIPGRGQEVEDHGLRPWKHRAGGTCRISDWLRSLRPRGENGPLPPRLFLHRPHHMYELLLLLLISLFFLIWLSQVFLSFHK